MKGCPNVVFIDCHDLGSMLGCYGWAHVPSPNIDRMASQGARCSNYFATAPICIPSRAGMYIGRYPHTVGCYGQDPYDEGHTCMAAWFRAHGYATLLSGWNMPNPPKWAGYEQQLSFRPTSEAVTQFFGEIRARPFLLHFSFGLVHRPFLDTSSQFVAGALTVPPVLPDTGLVRQDLACLCYRISLLDRCVGRILDAIRDNGLEDDTIVVFTTDHGPAIARAKHTLYDSGIRTALLLRYPRLIRPDSCFDALLSNVDLLPTITEMAGLPRMDGIDGQSFLRLLSGADYGPHTEVYATHTWGRRAGLWHYTPSRCIRTRRYKFIHNYTETPPYVDTGWLGRFGPDRTIVEEWYGSSAPQYELYDVLADPWELDNLADDPAHATLHSDLERRLNAHLEGTDDLVLRGFVPNKEGMPNVPLWKREEDGSYRLRAYSRKEGSDVPFGKPLRQPWASAEIR